MDFSKLLNTLSKSYYFDVYHAHKRSRGYLLETNYGPKWLTVWKDKDELEWSYQWRESLVKYHFRQVDRFILSKHERPYINCGSAFMTVQDIIKGDTLDLRQENVWQLLGYFMAKLYQAFEHASRHAHLNIATKQRWRESYFNRWTITYYASLKKDLQNDTSLFASLVLSYWPLLIKRIKQAIVLFHESMAETKHLFTLSNLQLKQWTLIPPGYVSFISYNKRPLIGMECFARLWQHIYLRNNSRSYNEAFYDSFAHYYKPTLNVQYGILANLIYPHRFLSVINHYVKQRHDEEACIQLWMKLCDQQSTLDQLHLSYADHIDQQRQEYVYL